jgi:hypothetical protein
MENYVKELIINLELQNKVLLFNQLHKLSNRENMPWFHLVLSYYVYVDGVLNANNPREGSFWSRGRNEFC